MVPEEEKGVSAGHRLLQDWTPKGSLRAPDQSKRHQALHSRHTPRLTASHAISPAGLRDAVFRPSLHQKAQQSFRFQREKSVSPLFSLSVAFQYCIQYKSFSYSRPSTIVPRPSPLLNSALFSPHPILHTPATLHVTMGSSGFPPAAPL